jgi:hypothetical protein
MSGVGLPDGMFSKIQIWVHSSEPRNEKVGILYGHLEYIQAI